MTALSTSTNFDRWFQPVPALDGASLMDHLFNRLDGAYPHKWRSAFPSQTAIDNWSVSWVEAFEEEGITPAMIKNGLKQCRKAYDWPPSCAEFIRACKPPLDPLDAFYEAVEGLRAREKGEVGKWSHPAIFWATVKISAYDVLNSAYDAIKKRWEAALNEEMGKGEWAAIPVPMVALPAPGKTQTDKDEAARQLNAIGASGVLNNHGSPKRWAKKIMERYEAGDRYLPDISVKWARQELGA